MKAVFSLIFTLILSVCAVFSQNAEIDSLKKVIETTKVDTVKGRSLCRLCDELRITGDFQNALKKADEGLMIAQVQKDDKGIANCLSVSGIIHWNQGNYPKALDLYQKCFIIYSKIGDIKGTANVLNNTGLVFRDMGNYPKALEYHQKSIRFFEQLNNKQGMASCYNNTGIIYSIQRNYAKAREYYLKHLKIKIELKDSMGMAGSLNNIGLTYNAEYNYSKALEFFQKGLKIIERLGNHYRIADNLNNIGFVYYNQKNYSEALEYHQNSLKIKEQIGDKAGIITSWINISNCYFMMQNLIPAKKYIEKALTLAQEIKYLQLMQNSAEVSCKIDSALGDYKSAFEHHKLYKQYSDSLHNEDKAKEFGRVESKYQFEKEAEEAKRKEAELAKIEAEKTERRNNLQYLTIFAGIIGLFAGLVFLGKFKIPVRVMNVAVFAGLLITFEFLLILFDPWLDTFSGGIPFYKLGFNALVAFAFAPLHGFLEGKLKKRLVRTEKM